MVTSNNVIVSQVASAGAVAFWSHPVRVSDPGVLGRTWAYVVVRWPARRVIDLRSDTITQPSPGMRGAIAAAVVGDEQLGEDPTVNELQERVAELLGQERALFLPTPSAIAAAIWKLAASGALWNHVSVSVMRWPVPTGATW